MYSTATELPEKALHVGQRVTASPYGVPATGTIVSIGPRSRDIIFVRFDGAKRPQFMFRQSLTAVEVAP